MVSEQKIKLFILDDEPDIVELLSDVFDFDFEVTTAVDPEMAFAILKNSSFDLLLTDLTMPKMNAFELIEKLKKVGVNIPVIIMSGFAEKEIHPTEAVRSSIQEIISKPIGSLDELAAKIRKFVKRAA